MCLLAMDKSCTITESVVTLREREFVGERGWALEQRSRLKNLVRMCIISPLKSSSLEMNTLPWSSRKVRQGNASRNLKSQLRDASGY